MEQFKKKLVDMGGGITVYAIVAFAIAIALTVCGFLIKNREEYVPFNSLNDGYADMDVVFVMGPFAEETVGDRTSKLFFIAETSDQMWYVLCTNPDTELPIYGVDISDSDIAGLTAQTVHGKSVRIPEEVVPFLVDFFSDSDAGINHINYSGFFGTHYLDTTATASRDRNIFFFLAGIIALLGLLFFFTANKQRKLIKMQLSEWESNGQLKELYDDFTNVDSIYASKLKLALSHNYLLDFASGNGGIRMIRLSEIDNVFLCNMIAGQPTTTNFIALEKESERYCVAKCPRKTNQFNLILDQLKTYVKKEKTL